MIEYDLKRKELERAKEIFAEYIKYDGMFGLFADKLIAKYQAEDNVSKPCTIVKLNTLLNYYIESLQITPEEKEAYQKVLAAEEDRKYIRGGLIAKAYIKYEGDWNKVVEALKDNPNLVDYQNYEKQVITNYRKLLMVFMNRANNGIKTDFLIVKELRERYSLKVLGLNGFKKAYEALKNNDYNTFEATVLEANLSKSALKALRLAFPSVYEVKPEMLKTLDEYIAKVPVKVPVKAEKVVDAKKAYVAPKMTTMQDRINFLRELLTYYLNSDLEFISDNLLAKFNLSKTTFKSTLVVARTEGDLAIKELINKYNAKEESLKVQHDEMVLELSNYLRNGIEINGEIVPFNIFDYYNKFGNINPDNMRKWSFQVLSRGESSRIYDFFNRNSLSGTRYKDIESLAASTNISVDGRSLDKETKLKIAKIMELKGIPLDNGIYGAFLRRVILGQYDVDSSLAELESVNQKKN